MINPTFRLPLVLLLLVLTMPSGLGMISLKLLDKKEAAKMGITMKSRPNGDTGVKAWLEFRKQGALKDFTYAELRMVDEDGKHLVSAMLKPHPVVRSQEADLVSVSFSVDPGQLDHCTFWLVAYGSGRGGIGYMLKVTDFLDPPARARE